MSAVDEVIAAVNDSQKIDSGTKSVLLEFLNARAPVLQTLEAAALKDLLNWLSGGSGNESAAPAAVQQLSAGQVATLLTATEQEMAQALDARVKQEQATRQALVNLGNAALAILARLLVVAL